MRPFPLVRRTSTPSRGISPIRNGIMLSDHLLMSYENAWSRRERNTMRNIFGDLAPLRGATHFCCRFPVVSAALRPPATLFEPFGFSDALADAILLKVIETRV